MSSPAEPSAAADSAPKAKATRSELEVMLDEMIGGEPPAILYHYTSQAGLLGIASTRKIWATNMAYLNDISEYDYGMDMIRDAVEKRRALAPKEDLPLFKEMAAGFEIKAQSFLITSLTEAGDLLSQWRGYTDNGNGFSIGFDTGALKARTEGGNMMLVRCIYEPARQREYAERLVDQLVSKLKKKATHGDKSFLEAIFDFFDFDTFVAPIGLAVSFKNPAFEQEREWRLVTGIDSFKRPGIRFRTGKSMIAPYAEVDLKSSGPKEPEVRLKSVIVGPCPFPALSVASVQMLLEANEHKECQVSSSTIPFRAW